MSDVNGPQPEGAGGPAPYGGPPLPPPPPPGLFPDTSPVGRPPEAVLPPSGPIVSEPPRPRKRGGLIVGIIVAVLLCGIGSCIAAVVGFGVLGNDQSETVALAESHFSAALDAVKKADASIADLKGFDAGSAEVDRALGEAAKGLRTGRDEIAAARAAAEQLDDSQGKSDYLASLEQATKAMDGLEDLLAYVGSASGMIKIVNDAGTAAQDASDDLNSAISAGNRSKYSDMKTKARSASSGYQKAAVLFDQAHKLDSSAELDKAAGYARKRKQQADVVAAMASDGKAGRVSAYNKGITKMNKLGAQADKIGEPAIASDPDWAEKRLSELNDAITAAADKADELRAKALDELGFSK